jgi:hypothetical protein
MFDSRRFIADVLGGDIEKVRDRAPPTADMIRGYRVNVRRQVVDECCLDTRIPPTMGRGDRED